MQIIWIQVTICEDLDYVVCANMLQHLCLNLVGADAFFILNPCLAPTAASFLLFA